MTQVILNVPEPAYREAETIAAHSNRAVEDVLTETLVKVLAPFPLADEHEELSREFEIFEQRHAELWQHYPHQFVAMTGGKVVDSDTDITRLAIRIEEQFPDTVVLIEEVRHTLPSILQERSPRLLRDEE